MSPVEGRLRGSDSSFSSGCLSNACPEGFSYFWLCKSSLLNVGMAYVVKTFPFGSLLLCTTMPQIRGTSLLLKRFRKVSHLWVTLSPISCLNLLNLLMQNYIIRVRVMQ